MAYDALFDSPQPTLAAPEFVTRVSIHAYCSTPAVLAEVRSALGDRRLARARCMTTSGSTVEALATYRDAPSPDLLIIESASEAEAMLGELDALADVCSAATKVVVIARINDIAFYRELIRRGVTDYIVAPVDAAQLIELVGRTFGHTSSNLGRSIAFLGAVGGAGSSTVAHNVAAALGNACAAQVILADFDLAFGSAALAFNVDHTQGMAEAVQACEKLDDVLFDRLLTRCGEYLSVLTAPAHLNGVGDIDEEGVSRILDTSRAVAPFVVLDLPHVWSGWAQKAVLSADDVVVTTTPTLLGLRNAKNLIDLIAAARPNDPPPKLVVNQCAVRNRIEIGPKQFAATLKIEPAACLNFDPSHFGAAANEGAMVVDKWPKSAVAQEIQKIAHAVSGRARPSRSRGGWFSRPLWRWG